MNTIPNCRWWLIVTLLFALSCKSGEKLYNKGRYDEAVILFVKKLRKKPTDATALGLLPKAYEQSVQQHERNASAAMASTARLKFEQAAGEYQVLQNLYNNIQACPAALSVVQPKDYRGQLSAAVESAAATRYNQGIALLNKGDILSSRKAYTEFRSAMSLLPDYKDAKELSDRAYQMGLVTLMVRNVALVSQYDMRSYEPNAAQFTDYMVNTLRAKNNNTFLRILSEPEVVNNKLHADYIVDIRVQDFLVSKPNIQTNFKELQKTVEIREQQDSTRPVKIRKETYKGQIFFNTVSIATAGNIECYLINTANDTDMEHLVLPADGGWANSFSYFKGDERVLAVEDRKQIGGKDLPSPTVGEMFQAAITKTYEGITNVVIKHYNEM